MSLVKLLLIKAQHDVDPYVVRIYCEVFIGNVTTVYDRKKYEFCCQWFWIQGGEYLQLLLWPLVTAIGPTSTQGEHIS